MTEPTGTNAEFERIRTTSMIRHGCPLEKLNFDLAYRRVQEEIGEQRKTGRAFAATPFEQDLVELDLDTWLENLRGRVLDRSYAGDDVEICGSPKGADLWAGQAEGRLRGKDLRDW